MRRTTFAICATSTSDARGAPVGSGPIESRWRSAASSRRAFPWSSGGGPRCTPQCGARSTCG
eukprot:7989270-Pyramimonas_sp.AAC.1